MRIFIKGALEDARYQKLIFIDASANIMGVERYERYIDVAAQEEYWRPKDSKLADDKQRNKKILLDEWKNLIGNGTFVVYKGKEGDKEEYKRAAGSAALLNDTLSEVTLAIYPLSFDNARVSDNFFTSGKYSDGAKRGINQTCGGIFQEKSIQALLGDVIRVPNYWEVKKSLSISKLKEQIKEFIDERFQTEVRISVGEIFDVLMSKGFMPCDLYAYLTGFLLKEYADEPYRYGIGSAGDDGGKMSSEKLGDFIGEYIKHKNKTINNYKEKYIEIMTQDQKHL